MGPTSHGCRQRLHSHGKMLHMPFPGWLVAARTLVGNTGLDDAQDDGGGYGEEGLPGHDEIQSAGE